MNISFRRFMLVSASVLMLGTASIPAAHAVTLYSVRPQDTLARIAQEHHVSVDKLKRVNADLRKSESVKVGQILMIPDADDHVTSDNDSHTIVIHNAAPPASHKEPTRPVAVVKVIDNSMTPTPATAVSVPLAHTPEALAAGPHDTQIIVENDAAAPTATGAVLHVPLSDNIAIIDSQIIHVPSAPVPVDATASLATPAGGTHPHPTQLASRRGSLIISILSLARHFMGIPYVWGGTTTSGFDCSGFVQRVFALNGVHLPRLADAQYYQGTPVKDPSPGDLIFFSTYLPGPSHVGIYLGGNQFIHASCSRGVTISSLSEAFFAKRYIGARRYF